MSTTHVDPSGVAAADREHLGKIHQALEDTLASARVLFQGAQEWHADTVVIQPGEAQRIRPAIRHGRRIKITNVGANPCSIGNAKSLTDQPNGGGCLLPVSPAGQLTTREIFSTADVWVYSKLGTIIDYQQEVDGPA